MNLTIKKFRSNIANWLFWYSLLSLLGAWFVPLYFVNNHLKFGYYIILLICLAITSVLRFVKWSNRIHVWAKTFVLTTSLLLGICFFLLLALITVMSTFFGYKDATVFYTQKSNPEVKIVSRYYDQGAFGGGTEPGDYETVLKRPVTSLFWLETKIDTNTINKAEWIKSE